MKGLLIAAVVLAAVMGSCSAQNTPAGLTCNPVAILDWVTGPQATATFWENLAVSRDFAGFCTEVNVWMTNLGGCIQGVLSFIDLVAGTSVMNQLQEFYNGLALAQFYCGKATLTQVCDMNAITGCAIPTALTFQASIQGTLQEVGMICQTYNTVLMSMNSCFQSAISNCPAAEKAAIEASYNMVYNYFELISMYCGETCGQYILLFASQLDQCDYVTVDYANLQFQEYCTYIQNMINCVWRVYSQCPAATPDQTVLGITGILSYAKVLGCNVNVGGVTTAQLDQAIIDQVLPQCPAAAITCTMTVGNALGLTTTAGAFGGYNYQGVITRSNEYFDRLTSGEFGDICILVNDVIWNTVTACANLVVTGCPTPSGPQAQLVINSDITPYIQGACAADCVAIQDAIENYMGCTAGLANTPLDPLRTTVETLSGFFAPGGGNVEICRIAQGYVNCILEPIQKCSFLYDNYVQLVTMHSTIRYSITVCNIQLSTATGDIRVLQNANNPIFVFSAAASYGASMVIILVALITWFKLR